MARTSAAVDVWTAQSNSAGATTTSASQDLRTVYDLRVGAEITNGGTGPTVAAYIYWEYSPDDTNWFFGGWLVFGDTANSAVVSDSKFIRGLAYVRFVVTGNTGQSVTAEVRYTKTTGN